MKKFGYFLLALGCPWLVLLMSGESWKAFIAFILQASILGWPFVTIWAWRVAREDFLAPEENAETTLTKQPNKKE